MICKTCNKSMRFADKINARSYDGNCVACTSHYRSKVSDSIENKEDKYLEAKQVLSSNLDAVYILAKKGGKSDLIEEMRPYGGQWLKGGSVVLTKIQILTKYYVFASIDQAEEKRQQLKDRTEQSEAALEQFVELKADLQAAARQRHLEVLKLFMRETAFIDRKILNQALFAVTLNKRFKKLFYRLENDNHFLDHATADVMEEVLELIDGLR